ncbi:MAG: hypothetical protein WDO14_04930 [Bacteroidota bacterium]
MKLLQFTLIAVALIISAPSLAQKPTTRERYIGVSAGIDRNILSGSEVDNQKKLYGNGMQHRSGPAFSAFVKNELNQWFYLKYELGYARRGNVSPDNALWSINLEYLTIPARFGVQPINFGTISRKFQFGIEGGFSFNYAPGRGTDGLDQAFSSVNATVRQSSVGALAGFNLEYKLPSRRMLFVNSTWYGDLTPLVSYQGGSANYKAGNKGWMLTAGIMSPW